MLDRKARLKALHLIQQSCSNAPITKEAFDVTGFLKETFQSFYQGIESQVNKESPILSALNFLAVGVITSYNPILGMIFSILGTSFGINFETIFTKIKSGLSSYLSSPDSAQSLSQNQDSIIPKVVSDAVNSSIRLTDDEVNAKFEQLSNQAPSISTEGKYDYNTIVKQAAPMGAALVQKFLPTIGKAFGGGRNSIVALLVWIVKAVLLGCGVIGTTAAMENVFGVKPKSVSNNSSPANTSNDKQPIQSNDQPSDKNESTTMSGALQNIYDHFKLSSDNNVVRVRPNNAPNDQRDGVDGGQQWIVVGSLADTLYKWIFTTYVNAAEVLSNNHISPERLKSAAKQVAQDFANKTYTDINANEFRIPREFNNVKDVVDLIISKAK